MTALNSQSSLRATAEMECASHSVVVPAKAGIQYAATYRFLH
jgi:hypothetical protein